ncbi:gephyrin-like molybdotransferase Glp [Corynebacterium sp. NPDC060344]|uniref:molybdopterin molybdotransferase MoeA n=1 Tax=Corynebacterium sp. NPDC060344 TaxID=3347101 RepID=UPI00365BB252
MNSPATGGDAESGAAPQGPLTVAQYLRAVLDDVPAPTPTTLPLADCAGLVLADDVAAKLPVPPFTNSAMDGFAVRAADLAGGLARAGGGGTGEAAAAAHGDTDDAGAAAVTLPVSADIPAGTAPEPLAPGTAARIMTGAPVPDGADAVIPVENTDSAPGPRPCPATITVSAEVAAGVSAGAHVRPAGEDVGVGDVVLRAGEVLSAAALASAASIGHEELPVFARPRVAVVATGAELVAPGQTPGPGQIPDSNAILLPTLVRGWGTDVTVVRASGDTADELADALARAAADAEVVVTSGGISAGAFDPVKTLAAEGRADISFYKLRQQPGGPQARGRIGGAVLLGLPGNPVSVFVSAILYLRPLLAMMAGMGEGRDVVKRDQQPDTHRTDPALPDLPLIDVIADAEFRGRRGKVRFVPVIVDGGRARPVHERGLGSHLIASLHRANALLVLPEAGPAPEAYGPGDRLTAIPLDPALRRGKDRHS